jgi:hypothetical protein
VERNTVGGNPRSLEFSAGEDVQEEVKEVDTEDLQEVNKEVTKEGTHRVAKELGKCTVLSHETA